MCRDPHYPTTNHGSKQDILQGDCASLISVPDQGKSGSIHGSTSTCQLVEEFVQPQNITAGLYDY